MCRRALVVGCALGPCAISGQTPLVEANCTRLGRSLASRDQETPFIAGPSRRNPVTRKGPGRCASSGRCPRRSIPKVFADYLLTLGMKTRVDERPDG